MNDLTGFPELATAKSVRELDEKYLKEIVELKYELEALWVHIKNLESKPNPGFPPVEKTIQATGHWGYGGTISLK